MSEIQFVKAENLDQRVDEIIDSRGIDWVCGCFGVTPEMLGPGESFHLVSRKAALDKITQRISYRELANE